MEDDGYETVWPLRTFEPRPGPRVKPEDLTPGECCLIEDASEELLQECMRSGYIGSVLGAHFLTAASTNTKAEADADVKRTLEEFIEKTDFRQTLAKFVHWAYLEWLSQGEVTILVKAEEKSKLTPQEIDELLQKLRKERKQRQEDRKRYACICLCHIHPGRKHCLPCC